MGIIHLAKGEYLKGGFNFSLNNSYNILQIDSGTNKVNFPFIYLEALKSIYTRYAPKCKQNGLIVKKIFLVDLTTEPENLIIYTEIAPRPTAERPWVGLFFKS
jgi:hypothetical protein